MKSLSYISVLLASAAMVTFLVWHEKRFSQPDLLGYEHAALEADCFACHDDERHIDNAKCSMCHTDPDTGESIEFAGFAKHHTYADLDCLECHTDHLGADASLTRAEHGINQVKCEICHERTMGKDVVYRLMGAGHPTETLHADHIPWQDDCLVCHEQAGGVSSGKCANCHDAPTTQPVQFAGFAKHHTYVELNCLDCHSAHRGRDGTLLKPGKSFETAGCNTCHERHVGPSHVYELAAYKHPDTSVRKAHDPWKDNCLDCHERDTNNYNCTTCHDPKTGKQMELKGYASHHFRKDLKCIECHTEHHEPDAVTRIGISFGDVSCEQCHPQKQMERIAIPKVQVSLRGKATHFSHDEHPADAVSCDQCHPMKTQPAHELDGPYRRNCSSCHHDAAQQAACETCHEETAEYFAGRFEGKLVPRGTHGRSDEVTCAACHNFDAKTNTFKLPESTCTNCHPSSYTKIFAKTRTIWQTWRETVETIPAEDVDSERLQFIGHNWYHNDTHSEKVRKQHLLSPKTPKG